MTAPAKPAPHTPGRPTSAKPQTIDEAMQVLGIMPADGLIALCAFRYALGRTSFVVPHVAGWLITNRHGLSDAGRRLMVREIDEAGRRNALGMDCDRAEWMRVREAFVASSSNSGGDRGCQYPSKEIDP